MSRKHFSALADLVSRAHYLDDEARARLVADLVTMCADANPRFSPSRFREACEPQPSRSTKNAADAVRQARAAWARTAQQLELVEL